MAPLLDGTADIGGWQQPPTLLDRLNSWRPAMAAIFAGMWLIDATATVAFVSEHGSQMEANPLMRALIDSAGLGAFAYAKAAVLGLWLAVHRYAHPWVHVALLGMMVPVVVAVTITAWGVL